MQNLKQTQPQISFIYVRHEWTCKMLIKICDSERLGYNRTGAEISAEVLINCEWQNK